MQGRPGTSLAGKIGLSLAATQTAAKTMPCAILQGAHSAVAGRTGFASNCGVDLPGVRRQTGWRHGRVPTPSKPRLSEGLALTLLQVGHIKPGEEPPTVRRLLMIAHTRCLSMPTMCTYLQVRTVESHGRAESTCRSLLSHVMNSTYMIVDTPGGS